MEQLSIEGGFPQSRIAQIDGRRRYSGDDEGVDRPPDVTDVPILRALVPTGRGPWALGGIAHGLHTESGAGGFEIFCEKFQAADNSHIAIAQPL